MLSRPRAALQLGAILALLLAVAAGVLFALDGGSDATEQLQAPQATETAATPTALGPVATPSPTPLPTPLPTTSAPGIYYVSRDGSVLRRLVSDEDISHGDLSPDGTEVIYSRGMDVAATNVQTGETRVVVEVPVPGYIGTPSWSSTGQYITFWMDEDGGDKATWIVNRDGSGLRRFMAGDENVSVADWLPDDSGALVFSKHLVGESDSLPPRNIFLLTIKGDLQGPLALYHPCYCGGGGVAPIVSPDGRYAAFSDHTYDVHLIDLRRSTSENLTQSVGAETLLGWLPDSSALVFVVKDRTTNRGPIFRFDVDDGSLTRMERFSSEIAPDGSQIEVGVFRVCGLWTTDLHIYTPTGERVNLTNGRIPDQWHLNDAQWLPDGSGIVFTASRWKPCN